MIYSDMENVPSKPSAAGVIIFGSGKFWVWTYASFVPNGENIIQYALPSCGG